MIEILIDTEIVLDIFTRSLHDWLDQQLIDKPPKILHFKLEASLLLESLILNSK